MKTIPNEQAFPCFNGDQFTPTLGLTKREYFAAMAMQGLATRPHEAYEANNVAYHAVTFADALIEKLNESIGEK